VKIVLWRLIEAATYPAPADTRLTQSEGFHAAAFRGAVISIGKLRRTERDVWAALWRDYLTFYGTSLPAERYEHTWSRLMIGVELRGFGARIADGGAEGPLVGIVHFLFHPNSWMNDVCYLQDLYVAETMRGQGVGRRLIEAVAATAHAQQAGRLYWMTQHDNHVARELYDRIARFNGFIRYDYLAPALRSV
jgi:ribosomal protein S18 acetylase RimI-like enzyme